MRAIFKGEYSELNTIDGIGYLSIVNGEDYILSTDSVQSLIWVRIDDVKELYVRSALCPYDSIESFLKNWEVI